MAQRDLQAADAAMLDDDHMLRDPEFWQQVLKPVEQFQRPSESKDLNDPTIAFAFSQMVNKSETQASLQAKLEVTPDEYKMLQAVVKQILHYIPLDTSGMLPQAYQIGNLLMPLTKALCDKLLLVPPRTAPSINTYGPHEWNRLIWYSLSVITSREKGQITRQGKRQNDRNVINIDSPGSQQQDDLTMDASDYEGTTTQKIPLKRTVNTTRPTGGSSATVMLKSRNVFGARSPSSSPFHARTQSSKAKIGTGDREVVVPAVRSAPPPMVYSSPIISFAHMNGDGSAQLLIEFSTRELFADHAADRDIATVRHADATAAARRHIPPTRPNVMTEYDFDVLTLYVPNNHIHNGEQSKDPQDDRFGVLASIALGENRMLIVFFVDAVDDNISDSQQPIEIDTYQHPRNAPTRPERKRSRSPQLEKPRKESRTGSQAHASHRGESVGNAHAMPDDNIGAGNGGDSMTGANLQLNSDFLGGGGGDGDASMPDADAQQQRGIMPEEETLATPPLTANHVENFTLPVRTSPLLPEPRTPRQDGESDEEWVPSRVRSGRRCTPTTTSGLAASEARIDDGFTPHSPNQQEAESSRTHPFADEDADEDRMPTEGPNQAIADHLLEDLTALQEDHHDLAALETALNQHVASFEDTNQAHEHLEPDVIKETLQLFGLENANITDPGWKFRFPQMKTYLANGDKFGLKLHQLIGLKFDLETLFNTGIELNADEQGLGKTVQALILTLANHVIELMLDNLHIDRKAHVVDADGCCTYAIKARSTFWIFGPGICPCKKDCPAYIRRNKKSRNGFQVISSIDTKLFVDDYIKFFKTGYTEHYTIKPVIFYATVEPDHKRYQYQHAMLRGHVRKFSWGDKEPGPSDKFLTRFVCVTTHKCLFQTLEKCIVDPQYVSNRRNTSYTQRNYSMALLILDEAHDVKKPDTMLWKCILNLVRNSWVFPNFCAMTGTPHENGPADLKAMILVWRAIWARAVGSDNHLEEVNLSHEAQATVRNLRKNIVVENLSEYTKEVRSICKLLANEKRDEITQKDTAKLRTLLASWSTAIHPIYRQRFADSRIFNEPIVRLPPLYFNRIVVDYSQNEQKIIGEVGDEVKQTVSRLSAKLRANNSSKARQTGTEDMIDKIVQLRPVAVFPRLWPLRNTPPFNVPWTMANFEEDMRLFSEENYDDMSIAPHMDELMNSSRFKIIANGFEEALRLHKRELPNLKCRLPPKLLTVSDRPFTSLLLAEALRRHFKAQNMVVGLYNSHLSKKEKIALRNRFDEVPKPDAYGSTAAGEKKEEKRLDILVGTIRLLSTGITLLRARRMYISEPQFNDSAEAQTRKRSHRIGQLNPVYCDLLWGGPKHYQWESVISSRASLRRFCSDSLTLKSIETSDASTDQPNAEDTFFDDAMYGV